jgi:hypothetical protein
MESREDSRAGPGSPAQHKTAYDYRDRLRSVTGWSDDDLQQLPIYDAETFAEGELYFNLNLPEVGPFRAGRTDRPVRGYLYVAKGQVPDHVWLRLIDGWGTDLPMGSQAPKPGAFGQDTHVIKTGYGSSGEEGAGEPTEGRE